MMPTATLPAPALSPLQALGRLKASYLLGAAIAGLCLLAEMLTLSPAYSYIALGLFAGFTLAMARHTPYTFVLLLGFLFLRVTMFVSGIAIGNGAYMFELATTGTPTAAFIRLYLVYATFLMVVAAVVELPARRLAARLKDLPPAFGEKAFLRMTWGVIGGAILLMLYAWYVGVVNGFPALTGADRFFYRADVLDTYPLYKTFLNNRGLICVLLGVIYRYGPAAYQRGVLALFLLYMATSLLFAEKFTSISAMMLLFPTASLLSAAHSYPWRNLVRFRPFLWGGLAIALVTGPAILYTYGWADHGLAYAYDRMLSRAAGQAQLWYVVDRDIPDLFRWYGDSLHQAWSMLFSLSPRDTIAYPYAGIYTLMATYMPNDLFNIFWDNKIDLAFGAESYLLLALGWVGMLVSWSLIGAVYGCYLLYWAYGMLRRDLISITLAFKLLIWSTGAVTMGFVWEMFGLKTLVLVLVATGYELAARRLRQPGRK